MGRHAVQRSRTILSLVTAGTVAALGAGILTITGAATAEGVKLSANLVTNPDFEKGTTGWNTQSTKTKLTIGTGHDSAQSGTITALAARQPLLLNDSPNVVTSATKGARYLASVWVRTDLGRLGVALRFREVNTSGGYVGKAQAYAVVTGGGWSQLKTEYVAAGDGDQIAVQVITAAVAKGGAVSIDDVDVRQVLEASNPDQPVKAAPKPSASADPKPSPSKSEAPKATPTQSSEAPKQSQETAPKQNVSASDTLFGEAMWMNSGETWSQALSRLEGQYGHMGVVRAYYSGLPGAWNAGLLGASGNRPVNVSFKARPQDVLAGKADAALRQWFASAPTDRRVWWTYYHEPEDNIKNGEFTAADYRAAWRHIVDIADQVGPSNLKATLVLMDWSLNPASGRNWKDYYPGSDVIDVLGWDSYNSHGLKPKMYYDPAWNLGAAVSVSKAEGKPFALAEWGSELVAGDDGSGRAAWMKDMARYMAQQGAVFATYFDCPVVAEYRLLDQPSKNSLRAIMAGDF